MKDFNGIENGKIIADYHVHIGQFYNVYYQPATIIKILADCGIKKAWVSSTTSLCSDLTEDKDYIINHVEEEIKEALEVAKMRKINITPLYRVVPKLLNGKSIAEIMNFSHYKGFKIHPKDDGYEDENSINKIIEEVCEYALKNQFPILIHTGEDEQVRPERFERFFKKYNNVKFVLAHCKEPDRIIYLFKKYNNVFGDTAFCPKNSIIKICNAGYTDRMQFGTDFPVTHWFKTECEGLRKNLLNSYKNTLKSF